LDNHSRADGDLLNFDDIHAAYRPRIRRYLALMAGADEAEDLTQEVFVKISRALAGFRGESALSTWIYKIAAHAALDRMRSAPFRANVAARPLDETPEGRMVARGALPDRQLIKKEMNQCILKLLEKLPEAYRAVVVLREMEGFRNREIAEILGLSVENVKVRLHRGRAMLKKEFQDHCDLYRNEQNELACDLKGGLREFRKSYWRVSFPLKAPKRNDKLG